MAMEIPSFPFPAKYANPIPNAYAWISGVNLDELSAALATVTFAVHPDAQSADDLLQPITFIRVTAGQTLVEATSTTPAVVFPTLAQLDATALAIQQANPGLSPVNAIKAAIYQSAPTIPAFTGATPAS